jgi:ribonuclease HI
MSLKGWWSGLWSFSHSKISFETTKVIKSKALAKFTTEWTHPFTDEPLEVKSTLPREEAPGLWVLHFDGAFNLPGAEAGAVLTSPTRDKLCYAIQLCFKPEHKVSNNITEYKGLLTGLRAVNALGIKCLIVKGDSQLVLNFSNKSYMPKDEHMAAYLEEHWKMEKRFQGLELKHIPRGEMWRRTKSPSAPVIASRSQRGLRGALIQAISFSTVNRARTSSRLAAGTRAGGSGLWATLRLPHPLGTGKPGRSRLDP